MFADLLKLIIVDDEHLVRNLLKNCINWSEIGYEVVGEASCAQEALELVDRVQPDVIFTDICMPYMDGIEFGKIVFEKYPLIKIIILTGYEEFEYAKRSIKIGIADFLLKPINDDEIKKVAISIKEKIESERTHRAEYNRLKKQLEENLPYLREKLLNELLNSKMDTDDIKQRLNYFHIKLNPDYFQTAVIEITHADTGSDPSEEEKLLLKLQCMEKVVQYFRDDEYINIFFDNSQRIVILNSEKNMDLTDCLEAVKTMLINKFKCFVCIGVGSSYDRETKIKLSYKEACNALEYKVITGKNQVISYYDINFSTTEQFQIQNDQVESLAFFLKAGMKGKAVELLETLFNENSMGKKASLDSIRVIASNIVSVVLNVITEVGINISDIFEHSSQPFDAVFKLDTFPETKEYLKNLIILVSNIIESMQSKKVNQAVKQVKDYIMENLSDSELTLSSTAKAFYMNLSYLSRIFKKETGQTFVEYLTKARMEKAIKLFKETDLKAYQVAENVGILDPHYFGICFKKYTGMSVNDFKRVDSL